EQYQYILWLLPRTLILFSPLQRVADRLLQRQRTARRPRCREGRLAQSGAGAVHGALVFSRYRHATEDDHRPVWPQGLLRALGGAQQPDRALPLPLPPGQAGEVLQCPRDAPAVIAGLPERHA